MVEGDLLIIPDGNISIGGKQPAAKWNDTVGLERERERDREREAKTTRGGVITTELLKCSFLQTERVINPRFIQLLYGQSCRQRSGGGVRAAGILEQTTSS